MLNENARKCSFKRSAGVRRSTGTRDVKRVKAAAGKLYESLVFTDQANAGKRQYLEWTATAFGGIEMLGVTILKRTTPASF